MQDQDNRFVPIRPLLAENGIEALTKSTQFTKRVDDAGRPVDPGDEAAVVTSLGIPAEGRFDRPGNTAIGIDDLAIIETIHLAADGLELLAKMIFADDAQCGRLDRLGMPLHGIQQGGDGDAVHRAVVAQAGDRGPVQAGGVQDGLLLGAARQVSIGVEL